jgi:hypothetical protein
LKSVVNLDGTEDEFCGFAAFDVLSFVDQRLAD